MPLVPAVPAVPDVPLVPSAAEVPDVPEVPLVPEVPVVPLVPLVPVVPDVPSTPVVPEVPDVPEDPSPPGVAVPAYVRVLYLDGHLPPVPQHPPVALRQRGHAQRLRTEALKELTNCNRQTNKRQTKINKTDRTKKWTNRI